MTAVLDCIRYGLYRRAVYEAFDLVYRDMAWRLPKRLVMWAAYRVLAEATTGKYADTNALELPAIDAISRFSE